MQSKVKSKIEKRRQCKYYLALKWIKNVTTKQIYQVDRTLSPDTRNCVYLIFCTKCKKQYVGQTKNEVRTRIYQHTHNILHKIHKRRFLIQHFLVHGLSSLRATVLQTNPLWSLRDRLRAEGFWINRLNTLYPRGLNEA
ncbi:MAG: GIY-YIG nuclease family protein [Cetobacterium sp.]|uniref:GIY-YIG nuclease family protein n=1 Tax=Cetobacterium sp. TaxID=2071632 RepID=UPI003F2AD301